jgi:3-oxoacyl-(acyl-carrier-protein) synthase
MVTDVLAGASDEMTAHSFTILERLGYWKRKDLQTVQLLDDTQRGTIAGEGAAFFLLGNNRNDRTRAEIRDVETVLCSGSPKETRNRFTEMIDRCGLQVTDLDLVIAGFNGDPCYDRTLHDFLDNELNTVPVAYYKHLCGEYNTSSSFALWLASMILSRQEIPQTVRYRHGHHLPVKHILICNHFRNTEHSYILVSQA